MPEIGYNVLLVNQSLKTRKKYENSKKQDIHDIFIKTNEIKLAFNMTWLLKILTIYPE